MDKLSFDFVNELGNRIEMTVTVDDRGITISATGPTSQVEHTWTEFEAAQLRMMLDMMLPIRPKLTGLNKIKK